MQDTTPPPALTFAQRYQPVAGAWDEFRDADGAMRAPVRPLTAFMDGLGESRLRQRAEQVRQLVRDHGVSYSVPGDAQMGERPWCLDAIPSLLGADEFAGLAAGLAQRARLLDRILADLYGPQRLLRDGYVPARLVLGNPGFLRACHGLGLAHSLHLYAADIVRTPTGGFCVLRDRTQAPTGAGYALENRLVMSQVFEEPFRQSNVQRLAPFFRTLRETLASLAPVTREHPRVVLQSSGSWSPTYFEQAFLAQYLGYPLVEGGDLTVRDRRVFLKTLGGLFPIDVIFRHPEDDYCDPLELKPDSQLGVPGLVEAVRAGHVAVANALGSGLAQSPAFLPYFSRIARDFFGESLLLESPPSFWCGDPASLAHVEAHLDQMVLRSTWTGAGAGAGPGLEFGQQLYGDAREGFLSRLRAAPEHFVAQERVAMGHAPVLVGPKPVARPLLLRGYAVLSGDSYEVMPGGLALASPTETDSLIAVTHGALAKDLWVRSDSPVGNFSLLPPATRPVELSREGPDLPSRSADNLFWLGRYAERAEALARLSRHLLGRLAEEGDAQLSASPALPTLFAVLAAETESEPLGDGPVIPWLARALCSAAPAGSLHNTIRAALRAAAAVRDRLSADTFRVLGALGDEATRAEDLATSQSIGSFTAFLDRVITSLSALSGLAMESMTRGHGWRFLDMGRRLERALQLVSLLRVAFASGAEREGALLETLLAVADSSITYRRRYLAGLHPAAVADLLLVDDSNPRAVLFQVAAIREHLVHLPRDASHARLRPEERLALAAIVRLQLLDVVPACQPPSDGTRPALHTILGEIENDLSLLSEQLCSGYLNHALLPRPLASAIPAKGPG